MALGIASALRYENPLCVWAIQPGMQNMRMQP